MDEVDELQMPIDLVSAATDDQSREFLIRPRADDSSIAPASQPGRESRVSVEFDLSIIIGLVAGVLMRVPGLETR